MQKGPKQFIHPSFTINTCHDCHYYEHKLIRSGQLPIFHNSCHHPNFKPPQKLNSNAFTPDWCPYLQTKEK
jgi:hypothetical protein